jgi:hypothetical protein
VIGDWSEVVAKPSHLSRHRPCEGWWEGRGGERAKCDAAMTIGRFALPLTILRNVYGATGRLSFVTLFTNHQSLITSGSLRHGVRRNPAALDHTSLPSPDPAPIFQGQQTDAHDDYLAGDKG